MSANRGSTEGQGNEWAARTKVQPNGCRVTCTAKHAPRDKATNVGAVRPLCYKGTRHPAPTVRLHHVRGLLWPFCPEAPRPRGPKAPRQLRQPRQPTHQRSNAPRACARARVCVCFYMKNLSSGVGTRFIKQTGASPSRSGPRFGIRPERPAAPPARGRVFTR